MMAMLYFVQQATRPGLCIFINIDGG